MPRALPAASFHAALAEGIAAVGASNVADFLETSESLVSEYQSPDSEKNPSLMRLLSLARAFPEIADPLAGYFARLSGAAVYSPDGNLDGLEAIARYAELHGEIVALFARSLARGGPGDDMTMSPKLASELIPPLGEARDILAGLAQKAQFCAEGG